MPQPHSFIAAEQPVESLIRVIRGQRVILDADLARVYGVTTKRLNEAVKRNRERFPSDFMFQLTAEEVAHLRSQFATSNEANRSQIATGSEVANRSQIVTGSQKHRDPRYLPYAFTEYGAFQAANVPRTSPACHPERSEGSLSLGMARRTTEILRSAQNDRTARRIFHKGTSGNSRSVVGRLCESAKSLRKHRFAEAAYSGKPITGGSHYYADKPATYRTKRKS